VGAGLNFFYAAFKGGRNEAFKWGVDYEQI
jgi:hypothetical protein